jgi:hypothetical protein
MTSYRSRIHLQYIVMPKTFCLSIYEPTATPSIASNHALTDFAPMNVSAVWAYYLMVAVNIVIKPGKKFPFTFVTV